MNLRRRVLCRFPKKNPGLGAETFPWSAVIEKVRKTSIRGRLGGKSIARGAFYKMLKDPFYAGAVRVQGELSPGLHEPMVSIEEFMKVQEMLWERRRNRK